MSARPSKLDIQLGDERFEALKEGLLLHPASETMIVADLHLEKGSAFAVHGQLLPPYDSLATLKLLLHAVFLHQPQRLISLGDAFHDHLGALRLTGEALNVLNQLRNMTEWTWVVGNHDPDPAAHFDDNVVDSLMIGDVCLRHELAPNNDRPEISGHYHPKAIAKVPGGVARCRCFVTDGKRLILPSFGVYTGGLNVLGEVIRPLLGDKLSTYLTSGKAIYPFPERNLLKPRAATGRGVKTTARSIKRVNGPKPPA